MREVRTKFAAIEVDRLRVKPTVKITGEFYLQTVEGDPNYNIHRWLEAEGAEVYPAAITVWMDYLLRLGLQRFEDYSGIEKGARLKLGLGRAVQAIYRGPWSPAAPGDGQPAAGPSRISSSCGGWPRPTSTAASTAARATCWSARRSGRTRRRRPT